MEIKPHDWYNTRQLNFIPKHFTRFKLDAKINRLKLFNWIEQNCAGRFAIGKETTRIPGEVGSMYIKEDWKIGFEIPADATMFSLFFK